ncbi:MAG: PAS domain S-box protein [Crocinitomicaceae bacterium]|nr:PAS domain S-box protein [Crocinitomicaceae bacterium]
MIESTIANLKSALFNSTIVVFTNDKGIITSVNKQYEELTGFSEEELGGNNFDLINSGYHDEAFFREMWETITSGKVWRG